MCALVAVFTYESGDPEAAEGLHEACLAQHPDAAVVQERAIEFFDTTGRHARGTEILREALDRDPERSDIRGALAVRLRAQGDPDGAEQVLREGVDHDPGAAPWLALAFHYETLRDAVKAKEALATALDRMPEAPPEFRLAYADIASRAGDHEEALAQIPLLPWPGFESSIRGRVAYEKG